MKHLLLTTLSLAASFVYADANNCCPKPCKPPCPPVCFERGYPDEGYCCIPSAYNEHANFEIGPCEWGFWVDASFTYWSVYEEGEDLAHSHAIFSGTGADVNSQFLFATSNQNTWTPGFKVGFGFDLGHDNWSAFGEYTWFRSTVSFSDATPPNPSDGGVSPTWRLSNWSLSSTPVFATSISSSRKINMDLADCGWTRPYYQGSHLIFAPFAGLRAAWIRQNLNITATPVQGLLTNPTISMNNHSNSWAIGPRAGLNGRWHFGWGLRLEGDVAGSINFTKYTNVSTSADDVLILLPEQSAHYSSFNTVRFNNDMSIGMGWGSYLDCRRYHLDLLLTYDFQIFWNQNMMRQLVDSVVAGVSGSASNLAFQGVTLRAQFDF